MERARCGDGGNSGQLREPGFFAAGLGGFDFIGVEHGVVAVHVHGPESPALAFAAHGLGADGVPGPDGQVEFFVADERLHDQLHPVLFGAERCALKWFLRVTH